MSNLFTTWHTRPLSGSSAESIFRKLSEDNNTAVTHLEKNKIKYAMKNPQNSLILILTVLQD